MRAKAVDLTGEDLFKIMLASRLKIGSLEALLEQRGYYPSEEKTENPVLMYQQQMEYRKKGDRWYCQIFNQTYDSSGKPNRSFTEVAFFRSDRTYFYRQEPSGSSNREGRIASGKVEFSGWMSGTPDIFFWHAPADFGERWQKKSAGRASAIYNKTKGTYILEFPYTEDDAPIFRYTMDPAKGYIPVIREWFGRQKESIDWEKCSDFRLVEGFWIPFRHALYLSNGNLVTENVIQFISINAPIPEITAGDSSGNHRFSKGRRGHSNPPNQ